MNLGLITVEAALTNIVDLRSAEAQQTVGLDAAILQSEPQGPTGSAYQACSRVAQVAHQLSRHGLMVPAATGRGVTVAVFTDLLPLEERPRRAGPMSAWEQLPADPRRLRLVREEKDGA